MESVTSCVSQIMRHFPTTYASSGHFAFQYGRYQDCIDSPAYTYHLIDFRVFQQVDGITMGICLPRQCSHKLVTSVLTAAFKLSGGTIEVEKVVTDPQNIQFDYSWLFYLTVSVLILLVLLVGVASLTRKKENWLKGFRLQQNIGAVVRGQKSGLSVLNGVRALTIMWIVMGDCFFNSVVGAVNVITLNFVLQRPFALLVETTLLATDIFFFLSGFFLAYKFTQIPENQPLKYPLALFRKLLRIMPAYLLTLAFYTWVFLHLRSGPKWVLNDEYTDLCKNNMWRSLLFIDNLVNNGKTMCMPWGFYLQIQMQFFVMSLVLLFVYRRSRLLSFLMAVGLIAYSWTINLIYTEQHKQKYPITLQALYTFKDYIFDVYIKPQYRCTPYLYGLFLAIAYREFLKRPKGETEGDAENEGFWRASVGGKVGRVKLWLERSRGVRMGVEWFGIFILCFVTFFPRVLQTGSSWPQWFHSMCINFGRILYPFAITLILGPTLLGVKGSVFRTFLDTPFFNFLSRISYGVYLVHGMAIFYINWGNKADTYLSIVNAYVITIAAIVISIVFGFLLTVVVELPFRKLWPSWSTQGSQAGLNNESEADGLLLKEPQEKPLGNEINHTIAE